LKYRLIYTRKAEKDIEKLPRETKSRIGKKLKELSANPIENSEKLSDSKLGSYRFRIGNYRIIFDLLGAEIVILRVGHRKDIYR